MIFSPFGIEWCEREIIMVGLLFVGKCINGLYMKSKIWRNECVRGNRIID